MLRRVTFGIFMPLPPGPTTLVRVICGFLLAPFLVTIPFSLVESGFKGFLSAFVLASLAVPVTVALGLPVYLLLRWKNFLLWYHFAIAGALAAALPLFAVYIATNMKLYASLELHQLAPTLLSLGQGIASAALLGCFVALAFWVLVHSRFQLMPVSNQGTHDTTAL